MVFQRFGIFLKLSLKHFFITWVIIFESFFHNLDVFFANFGGDFLFGRPDGPKAPPRVDFGSQKSQKSNPFWRPKSRFLVSFLSEFFAWILHEISVAILRFLGHGWKIWQKSLQNLSKKSIDFCTHLGADFSRFFVLFGTSWNKKN